MQVSVGERSIQVVRMGERADKLPLLAIRYEEIKPGHRAGCNNLHGKVSSLPTWARSCAATLILTAWIW